VAWRAFRLLEDGRDAMESQRVMLRSLPTLSLPSSCNGKMVSLYIEEIIKTPRVTQNFVGRNGKPIINN
jgi:hypothetical protein